MGLLDDVLGSAVRGGNVSKPLMIALSALLGARTTGSGGGLGSLLEGGATPQTAPPKIVGSAHQPPAKSRVTHERAEEMPAGRLLQRLAEMPTERTVEMVLERAVERPLYLSEEMLLGIHFIT
jgi:hypothetical protein